VVIKFKSGENGVTSNSFWSQLICKGLNQLLVSNFILNIELAVPFFFSRCCIVKILFHLLGLELLIIEIKKKDKNKQHFFQLNRAFSIHGKYLINLMKF
jgi:hypothetical protein